MTRQTVPAALLADVKNYLNITWDGKLGGQPDYEADGMSRTLLMEYVRYARDSALDVFESNYQALILTAQQESMVSDYAVESALQAQD